MLQLSRVEEMSKREEEVILELFNHTSSYYNTFDEGHDVGHMSVVVNNAIHIRNLMKDKQNINYMQLITAAMYHDIGLGIGRKGHHIESAKMAKSCNKLKEHFSDEDIEIISSACKEHRSSSKDKHSSIISMILADADSLSGIDTMIYRCHQYNGGGKGVIEEVYHHLAIEKFGRQGYNTFVLKESQNIYENEYKIYDYLEDRDKFNEVYKKVTGYDN